MNRARPALHLRRGKNLIYKRHQTLAYHHPHHWLAWRRAALCRPRRWSAIARPQGSACHACRFCAAHPRSRTRFRCHRIKWPGIARFGHRQQDGPRRQQYSCVPPQLRQTAPAAHASSHGQLPESIPGCRRTPRVIHGVLRRLCGGGKARHSGLLGLRPAVDADALPDQLPLSGSALLARRGRSL